jgi:L-seryl-tRNA(Ser) seleniumtransferase
MKATSFDKIPSVEKLVSDPQFTNWETKIDKPVRVRIARKLTQELREKLTKKQSIPAIDEIKKDLERKFEEALQGGIRPAINGTGVVLHTNLGRAPLGEELTTELVKALSGYCFLEMDDEKGVRGQRTDYLENLICLLTGAEAAAIVNNNAAALMLILSALCQKTKVMISRGELVQIGGGFKVPEIIELSGCELKEVGTTNMTSLKDFEKGMSEKVSALLKVHHSNFVLKGHTESPDLAAICDWAHKKKLKVVLDLGSGQLQSTKNNEELSVTDALHKGIDVLCFSGDKLLGGPQAGFILGDAKSIQKIKTFPLYRALRLGKTEIFLLEKILKNRIQGKISLGETLIQLSQESIQQRAEAVLKKLPSSLKATVEKGEGSVGGGAKPSEVLPTALLWISVEDSEDVFRRLLKGPDALVVRKEKKRIGIDFRTVLPKEDAIVLKRLSEVC